MLLLERTAPAKAGGEGAQGPRELERSYNGSSSPPPAQDLSLPPFALTLLGPGLGVSGVSAWLHHL